MTGQGDDAPATADEHAEELPPGTDRRGVPTPGEGTAVAILLAGVVVGLLALIATVGWIVYDHL